jgi:tetratricopeptide (TPR) repeat protein
MADRRDERVAKARLTLGVMLQEIGKDACAAEVLRAGLSYDPESVELHVALGFTYGRLLHYEEMLGAFMEAIRIDRRRAIEAACEEPAEIEQVRQFLYGPAATEEAKPHPAVPAAVIEAAELVGYACEHLGHLEAVDALERAVRLDSASADPASMLAFAYLLVPDERREERTDSVLWEVSEWLARLLFR